MKIKVTLTDIETPDESYDAIVSFVAGENQKREAENQRRAAGTPPGESFEPLPLWTPESYFEHLLNKASEGYQQHARSAMVSAIHSDISAMSYSDRKKLVENWNKPTGKKATALR